MAYETTTHDEALANVRQFFADKQDECSRAVARFKIDATGGRLSSMLNGIEHAIKMETMQRRLEESSAIISGLDFYQTLDVIRDRREDCINSVSQYLFSSDYGATQMIEKIAEQNAARDLIKLYSQSIIHLEKSV